MNAGNLNAYDCKKYLCQECDNTQVICSSCSLKSNPVKHLPIISATSTYNNGYCFENTLIPGTGSHWSSRGYAEGDCPGAEDDIIYRVDGENISYSNYRSSHIQLVNLVKWGFSLVLGRIIMFCIPLLLNGSRISRLNSRRLLLYNLLSSH